MEKAEEIIHYWFGDIPDRDQSSRNMRKWFTKDPEFDEENRRLYENDVQRAHAGEYDDWKSTGRGCLALIILLDQLPRNIYRGSGQSFSYDEHARAICKEAIDQGKDKELWPIHLFVFTLPLMHSEDIADHQLYLRVMEQVAETANDPVKGSIRGSISFLHKHSEIIQRFGRYPHRNALLGRQSTPEEEEFLKENPGF